MRRALVLGVLLAAAASARTQAYSVLTHEAIVDAVWARSIVPILQARYHPTADGLRRAHAFAYGGCMIQGSGYREQGLGTRGLWQQLQNE